MFYHWLNLSLTSRSVWAFFTAFLITICLGKFTIKCLQKKLIGQVVRDDGPESHLKKTGTPTMGGVLILWAIVLSSLLWNRLDNPYVWIALLSTIAIAALGFWDDWKKLALKNPKGVSAKFKIAWQTLVALLAGIALYHYHQNAGALWIPLSHHVYELSWGFVLFAWLVMTGSSNAVNLTDGLDGLVIVPVILVCFGLGIFALIQTQPSWIAHFHFQAIAGSSEMLVLCASTIGAGLAFLCFNSFPAQVFMGDVGALALGMLLAVMAIVLGQEWAYALMAGLFIVEALTVMLQVGSYKLRNQKRIFKMAPIHHHFELCGWFETKVTARFWVVAVIFLVLGLVLALY